MMTSIRNPLTRSEFNERDHLLKELLSIDRTRVQAEYPIVLHMGNPHLSYCFYQGEKLLAHANMWPRRVKIGEQRVQIALVGNVVTREEHRGQGHMRFLLEHLEHRAIRQKISALLLWSDLESFYQKLGFLVAGKELRCTPKQVLPTGETFILTQHVSDRDLADMLRLKPRLVWEIERSISEFRRLLTIPDCSLYVRRDEQQIVDFFLMGRGSDMKDVIHEWGFSTPASVAPALKTAQSVAKNPTWLVPAEIREEWVDQTLFDVKEFPMGMLKLLQPSSVLKSFLERTFVWGLDSI